jgi:hypothetical protein
MAVLQHRGCMGEARFELLERRDFHAPDGIRWRVQEALAFDIPGAFGPSCLIFDSAAACHRLWTYPADWAALPVLALLALSERRR